MKPWHKLVIGCVIGLLIALLLLSDADVTIAVRQAKALQHQVDSLRSLADSLDEAQAPIIVRADSAAEQVIIYRYLDRDEVARFEHERKSLDTLGADSLKLIILWARQH